MWGEWNSIFTSTQGLVVLHFQTTSRIKKIQQTALERPNVNLKLCQVYSGQLQHSSTRNELISIWFLKLLIAIMELEGGKGSRTKSRKIWAPGCHFQTYPQKLWSLISQKTIPDVYVSKFSSFVCCCCCSVAKPCPTLHNHMDCSGAAFLVPLHLPACAQVQVHWIGDAVQPSQPLLPSFPSAFNLSQSQGLFLCFYISLSEASCNLQCKAFLRNVNISN